MHYYNTLVKMVSRVSMTPSPTFAKLRMEVNSPTESPIIPPITSKRRDSAKIN